MNKDILLEIQRIQEVMGVKSNRLISGPGPSAAEAAKMAERGVEAFFNKVRGKFGFGEVKLGETKPIDNAELRRIQTELERIDPNNPNLVSMRDIINRQGLSPEQKFTKIKQRFVENPEQTRMVREKVLQQEPRMMDEMYDEVFEQEPLYIDTYKDLLDFFNNNNVPPNQLESETQTAWRTVMKDIIGGDAVNEFFQRVEIKVNNSGQLEIAYNKVIPPPPGPQPGPAGDNPIYFESNRKKIDNSLRRKETTIPSAPDKVKVGEITLESSDWNEIKKVLDGVKKIEDLTPQQKKELARVISQDSDLVDSIYKQHFQEYVDNTGMKETEIYVALSQNIKQGIPLETSLKTYCNNDEFLVDLVAGKVNQKLDSLAKGEGIVKELRDPITPDSEIGNHLQRLNVYEIERANDFGWWRTRFGLSNDFKVFNLFRRNIDAIIEGFYLRRVGTQKYIEEIYEDLYRTLDQMSVGYKDMGDLARRTEMRSTAQKINVLAEKYNADKEWLYKAIETKLRELPGIDQSKIPEAMEKLKKFDPANNKDLDFWQFLSTTASSKYLKLLTNTGLNIINFGKGYFSRLKTNLGELLERSAVLGVTGAPKTVAEIREVYNKNPFEGTWELVKGYWFAIHVGMPATLIIVNAVANFLALLLALNPFSDRTLNEWWENFTIMDEPFDVLKSFKYDGQLSLVSSISPFHTYLFDIKDWANGVTRGDIKIPIFEWISKSWNELWEDTKRTSQETKQKVIKKTEEVVKDGEATLDSLKKSTEEIVEDLKTEVGSTANNFVEFCNKNFMKPYGGDETKVDNFWISGEKSTSGKEFGIDEYGQKWIYNLDKKNFVRCTDCSVKASAKTYSESQFADFAKDNSLGEVTGTGYNDTTGLYSTKDGKSYEYCSKKQTFVKNSLECN